MICVSCDFAAFLTRSISSALTWAYSLFFVNKLLTATIYIFISKVYEQHSSDSETQYFKDRQTHKRSTLFHKAWIRLHHNGYSY